MLDEVENTDLGWEKLPPGILGSHGNLADMTSL
jgi:hypothetical protein